MARLADEYPLVFEEYVNLFDRRHEGFRAKRERTRMERVQRMFARKGGKWQA